MRVWSWMLLGGVGAVSLVGCAQHKVDPYTAAGLTRPTDMEAAANAANEVWKVSGLEFHDTSAGGYWTFTLGLCFANVMRPGEVGIVAASLGGQVVQTDRHELALSVCKRNGERQFRNELHELLLQARPTLCRPTDLG